MCESTNDSLWSLNTSSWTPASSAASLDQKLRGGKSPPPHLNWEEITVFAILTLIIVITVAGNTLVIIAVATTRRLRTVTNCYVMSLAVADCLVGVFVMPPAIALKIMGSWELGMVMCDLWISLDVLCCTASILSLCAISVDRYLAVTQPLVYSRRRRSKKLALIMIFVVWVAAFVITCPPILGCVWSLALVPEWFPLVGYGYPTVFHTLKLFTFFFSHVYEYIPGTILPTLLLITMLYRHEEEHHAAGVCRYNQNSGYVIFSAMGSFFIPLIVMLYVYARISCVVSQRHEKLGGGTMRQGSRRSQKFVSCNDESECLERVENDDMSHQPSVMQSTSLNGDQHETKLPRSVRTLHPLYHPHAQHHHKELCTCATRLSFYGSSNRVPRPESLIVDIGTPCGFAQNESSSRVSSFRRESKTTRTLTIVVGGFVACWLPFFITYLVTPFLPSPDAVPELIQTLLIWLGWINSAINPFIYAFYSVDFRTAFWRLTFRHCTEDPAALHFTSRNK